MDLASGYAAGAASDALTQIVKQRLLEQQQADAEQQQAFDRQMRTAENARAEKELADREAATKDTIAQNRQKAALNQIALMQTQNSGQLQDYTKPGATQAQTGLGTGPGSLAAALPKTDLFAPTPTTTAAQPVAPPAQAPVKFARQQVVVPGIYGMPDTTITPKGADEIQQATQQAEFAKARAGEMGKGFATSPGQIQWAYDASGRAVPIAYGGDKEEKPTEFEQHMANAAKIAGHPLSPTEWDAAEKAYATRGTTDLQNQINLLRLQNEQQRNAQGAGLTDAQKDMYAGMLIRHEVAPDVAFKEMGGSARGRQDWIDVLGRAKQGDPNFNQAAAQAAANYGASTSTQTTVREIDQLTGSTIPYLENINKQFQRSGYPTINGFLNAWKNKAGGVDIDKYNMAIAAVQHRLDSGGTAEVKKASDVLNGDMTAAQMQTVLDTAKGFALDQRQYMTAGTPQEQRSSGTQPPPPDPNAWQRPASSHAPTPKAKTGTTDSGFSWKLTGG